MIDPDDSDRSEPAGPEIPLPRLYERDIDVLLREELLFGRPVQWLSLDALKLPCSAQRHVRGSPYLSHSFRDPRYGWKVQSETRKER